MTDGIGHRHDAQPERQRHTDQTDTNLWKRCGDNRAAATRECQPKRPDRFGGIFLRVYIAIPPKGVDDFKARPSLSIINSSPADVKKPR